MREKTNYDWNCNLESNVIDLAKAKKIIRNNKNKNKNKLKKHNGKIEKIKNNTQKGQLNKHKRYKILNLSIYKKNLILIIIIILMSVVNFMWFKNEISKNIYLTRFGVKSTGRIIDTIDELALFQRGDNVAYRSIIEFKTQNGENIKFKTGVHRDYYKYNSEIISVVYNANDPKTARVNSFEELIMPIITFSVSGIVFVFFPIYLIYFSSLKNIEFI